MENFGKCIVKGCVESLWRSTPLLTLVFAIYNLHAIQGETGYWAVSGCVLAIVCFAYSIAVFGFFGMYEYDYEELSNKRNAELNKQLDNKEKESQLEVVK